MKIAFNYIVIIAILVIISSCEKDEGKLPNISFKTGGSYIAADATVADSTTYTIGINASKSEKEDVLKKFNITKSVNGAAGITVFDKTLGSSEEDSFGYDLTAMTDTSHGQTNKYV